MYVQNCAYCRKVSYEEIHKIKNKYRCNNTAMT